MANVTTQIAGVTIADGTASGITLDATCDVSAAAGAGGTPADGSITNAKLADMAQGTLKGRAAGAGTGVPSDRTMAQVKTDLVLVAADVGLGNVTNESKATMFTNAVLTGTVTIPDAALAIADTSGLQTALDAKEALSCIARGSGAAVSVASTSVVNMASATNTVAAGDTYRFYFSGYVLNNSGGTRTYTVRVTIGATTFDLAVSPTYATSASNVGWLNVVADVAVISSSSIACTIQVRAGASAAVGTVQNNVLANDRNIVRTSTNNETGSKTIAVGMLADANTATQTFTRTRAEIYKGAAI